jgi:hypothetical protein
VFPRWRGETRLGEWCSDEVGEVDRGGDIGRIGEIGDRFLIALASIISDPSGEQPSEAKAAREMSERRADTGQRG